jgi:phage FluMu protein Com
MLERSPAPACTRCGKLITIAVTIPRLGSHPEIQALRCADCRNVMMLVDGQEERPSEVTRPVRRYWGSR